MKINLLFFTLLLVSLCTAIYSQVDSTKTTKEKIKTGWTWGGVPAIAYDSDIGFKYGAVINFYHFGHGSTYPKYRHSLYFEWSRTTKGSGINQFTYDSEHLIPGIRVSAEASLLTEKALDFYGFNGYESFYNSAYEDDEDTANYLSRMFYRVDRKLSKIRADFYIPLIEKKVKLLAGIEYTSNNIGTVNIDKLNKGKDTEDLLPDTALLYDKYVEWGVIKPDQAEGGKTTLIKLGLVYDTRNNEPNPMKGIWTDAQLLISPKFLGDFGFTRLALTHRQYFTLVQKKLSFAYRLSYQAKLSGEMPYYMLPFVYNTAPNLTRDGLGGAKTIRGVLRNRVVGEDFAYGNFELRWKFLRTVVLNQNLYIALNTFADMGMVLKKFEVNTTNVPVAEKSILFPDEKESLHVAYGAGLHFAINENFIVAVDYGMAAKKDDGNSGLYIGLNFLY